MKLDISVAPEIAMLAAPGGGGEPRPAGRGEGTAAAPGAWGRPATTGQMAACLRLLVADPQTWWDLVRFDPHRPSHVTVTAPSPGCETWLLVLPPRYHGGAPDWDVACLVAGALAVQSSTPAGWQDHTLRPSRIRVRGGRGPYRMVNAGDGYAVSLHARALARAQAHPG